MDGDRGGTLNPDEVELAGGVTRRRVKGCQRGLRWTYRLPETVNLGLMGDELEREYGGKLIRGSEQWGAVTVLRYVLQFQAEFRFGERPREVALLHRTLSSAETRLEHHRRLESILLGHAPLPSSRAR